MTVQSRLRFPPLLTLSLSSAIAFSAALACVPAPEPAEPATSPPVFLPGAEPGVEPDAQPGVEPDAQPGVAPEGEPSATPGVEPGTEPAAQPGVEPDAEPDPVVEGSELYAVHCASCHGDDASGGSAPALQDWAYGRAFLVERIDTTMPPSDPTACGLACADRIASWLLSLSPPAPPCTGIELPARGLRLLTRAELQATVQHTFASLRDANSGPCESVEFRFAPEGVTHTSVHVAGEFNDWPATVDAGGWALVYRPDIDRWVGTFDVPNGSYQYKFVLDDVTWISDASNPVAVDDGFGGQNSILTQDCPTADNPGTGLERNWTGDLPLEGRPNSFPFDNHAASALVDANHVNLWADRSEQLAALAASDLEHFLPCGATTADEACLDTFVQTFVAAAYRRQPTVSEVNRVKALVRADEIFARGIETAVRVVLQSPQFLYRSELGVENASGTWTLTSDEVGTLMAYWLTGAPPDAELLAAAAAGTLATPLGREQQARRLLESEAARSNLGRFAQMWLGTKEVLNVNKATSFTAFTDPVRQSMNEETRRFFMAVALGDGSFQSLLTAEWTVSDSILNTYLDRAIGDADGFTMTPNAGDGRVGILGHSGVLSTYGYSDQTSPVRRGLFIRERLLCQDLGVPPPTAGAIPEVDPTGTTRERFEQHSTNPSCNACHQFIDDLGFGLEHFDTVGTRRETEAGRAIDASGLLRDVDHLGAGTSQPFDGLAELAGLLADAPRTRQCFVAQTLRHYSGVSYEADSCAVATLDTEFVGSGSNILELLVAIARSNAFVLRRAFESGAGAEGTQP